MTVEKMSATMMHEPLGTATIVEHGERIHANSRIGLFDGEKINWRSFKQVAEGARRLASALASVGVSANTRVATLCWNDFTHFEAYLAVPAMRAVLHTLNLRLHPDQLRFIMADAQDAVLIADGDLLAGITEQVDDVEGLSLVLVTGNTTGLAGLKTEWIEYAAFVEGRSPMREFPAVEEDAAAAVCYTSGTTGNPKGVVYSHRTIFLHSLASMGVNAFGISEKDRILLMPPMFHANAWGLPFSGWFAGADFILPGPHLQPEPMREMIRLTSPSFTATVPTILNDLLRAHSEEPLDMSSFRTIVAGGSAVSRDLIARVDARWGVPVVQGWGMTETSPLCVLSHPPADVGDDEAYRLRAKSGRPVPGVRARVVGDDGKSLAEDGETTGRLQLRGAWIARGYHRNAGSDVLTDDGWLDTGDAGTIDERGYVQVTDRLKDLIKSGGEWIPSVELENLISGLEGVDLAAVIGMPDERWEERPLAVITGSGEGAPDFVGLRVALRNQVARFWIPEYWSHQARLPLTSVGKIDKQALRRAVDAGEIAIEKVDRFR